jgi:hypothetical protein
MDETSWKTEKILSFSLCLGLGFQFCAFGLAPSFAQNQKLA